MQKKNKLMWIVALLVFTLICGGIIWYKLATRQVYIPDIPNSYNLSSISYELPTGIETVSDEAKMDKILNGISKLELETKSVSVQDVPSEVSDLVAIRLNYKEDAVGSFYIYSKSNKYYFEEPYNGIYKIKKDDYEYIINLIK